jgi:hypothetical protein
MVPNQMNWTVPDTFLLQLWKKRNPSKVLYGARELEKLVEASEEDIWLVEGAVQRDDLELFPRVVSNLNDSTDTPTDVFLETR